MPWNESGRSRCSVGVAVGRLALITLVVLTAAFLFPAAQAKDNPKGYTAVYQHTYDEAFQAAQDAIERKGWLVTGTDKDKGIISGEVVNANNNQPFELHVQVVSQKPETRIDLFFIRIKGGWGKQYLKGAKDGWWGSFASELQKVLVTYR